MKTIKESIRETNTHIDACGNCWGYQEWDGEIKDSTAKILNIESFVVKIANQL